MRNSFCYCFRNLEINLVILGLKQEMFGSIRICVKHNIALGLDSYQNLINSDPQNC